MSEFENHHVTLHAAFKEAIFEFTPGDHPENFWVITAYNPDGQDTNEISNQLADEKLYEELNALGVEPFRVTGLSPDRTHAEPGWGGSLEERTAIELGRKYRQVAVFHFQAGEIWLVDCSDGRREALDNSVKRF
jgi:hypothetical protein